MAAGRAVSRILGRSLQNHSRIPAISSIKLNQDQDGFESAGTKSLRALALLGAGVSSFLGLATLAASTHEAEHGLECPSYPWPHKAFNEDSKFTSKSVHPVIQCLLFLTEIVLEWHTQRKRPRLWLLRLRWLTVNLASSVIVFHSLMLMNKQRDLLMVEPILRI